jgi:hypothetical protein
VWSILPTRLLLVASPYVGNGGYQSVQAELAKRINALQLDRERLADTVDLVVEHARSGPPETAAWNGLYFQVSSALMRAIPPDDPMLLRFLEVPPTFLVSFLGAREGRPHLLGIDALEWWPAGVDAKLVVEFADGTVRQARFNPASQSNQLLVEMPAAVNAGDTVRLVLSVRAGGAGDDAWRDYPAAYTQIPEMLGRGPTEPDAKPIDSPELRAAVTSVFYPDHELVVWADGTPRAGLQFSNAPATGPEMASILFGLRVEIREGDAVRRTSRIWWAGVGGASRVRWLPPIEDIESLARLAAQDPALDANWTVRITGDPDLADYARPPVAEFPARSDFRYWSGSIEFPLKVLRAGGSSPLRRWTPVDP